MISNRPGQAPETFLDDEIQVRPGHGAALCQLAADLPTPLLAELLGVSICTAA